MEPLTYVSAAVAVGRERGRMFAEILCPDDFDGRDERCAPAIRAHPVFALFPPPIRRLISREGQLRSAAPGEGVKSSNVVGFVVEGVLGVFDTRSLACVALQGPGSTFGWEATITHVRPSAISPFVETRWVELDADRLRQEADGAWLEHVFARHAVDRIQTLQAEAACAAAHPVPQRTARLLARLHSMVGTRDVRTTEAILARAIGVQRTSVNAALKTLERDEAIKLQRGRIRVLNTARLNSGCCGCQEPTPEHR